MLPDSIRSALNWNPGMELAVERRPEGVLLRTLKPFAETEWTQVVGSSGCRGPRTSLKDMDEGSCVKRANAGDFARYLCWWMTIRVRRGARVRCRSRARRSSRPPLAPHRSLADDAEAFATFDARFAVRSRRITARAGAAL